MIIKITETRVIEHEIEVNSSWAVECQNNEEAALKVLSDAAKVAGFDNVNKLSSLTTDVLITDSNDRDIYDDDYLANEWEGLGDGMADQST